MKLEEALDVLDIPDEIMEAVNEGNQNQRVIALVSLRDILKNHYEIMFNQRKILNNMINSGTDLLKKCKQSLDKAHAIDLMTLDKKERIERERHIHMSGYTEGMFYVNKLWYQTEYDKQVEWLDEAIGTVHEWFEQFPKIKENVTLKKLYDKLTTEIDNHKKITLKIPE